MVEDNATLRTQLAEVQHELRSVRARLAELESHPSNDVLPGFHILEASRRQEALRAGEEKYLSLVESSNKDAAEALRQSEARYRSIVEDQIELVCRYDRNCRLTFVNRAYAELYQKQPEELIGTSFLDLIPQDARPNAQAYVWSIQADAPVAPYEHVSIVPDGSQRWYQWTDRALTNERGEIVEYQGVGRDITERKQAEAHLKHHTHTLETMQQFLQTALNAFPANTAVLDPDGNIISVNAPWIKFAQDNNGTSPTWFVQDNYLAICDNATGPMSHEATLAAKGIRAVIAGRQDEFSMEYTCDSPHDERWYMLRILPFAEPTPRRVLLAHIDITEQEKAERTERQQRRIAETLRDSLAVLTSSLDAETVMQLILAYSANIIPSDAGAIILFEGNLGRVAYTRGFSAEAEAYYADHMIAVDAGTFNKDGVNIQSYLAADTRFTPNWIVYPFAEWIQSSIGVPIVLGGKSIGLLTADSKTANHFQHKDVENLLAFASQAALALENAQNFDRLERRVNERTAELQAAKERVEAILNSSADGILLVDANYTIRQTNAAAHRLFACAPDVCQVQPVAALFSESDDEFIAKAFQATVVDGAATHLEIRARRCDGTEFDAELSIGAIKDGGWVCNVRDITERKKADENLQKSAKEIHDLYNSAPCGYHSVDKDGLIIQINDTELQWLGYHRHEVIGKMKFSELLTPESLIIFQQNFPAFQARGWVNDLAFDIVRKDGSRISILLNSIAIMDEAGHYLHSRSSAVDITDLKRVQQALAESEMSYRLLAENVTDVIAKMTPTGLCTFVTPSSYTLLGYLPEEIVGRRAAMLVHPDDLAHTKHTLRAADSSQSSSFLLIQRLRHKMGHYVWIEVKGSIVRDPATGKVVEHIGVFRDITERKRTEEILDASLQQERQFQSYLKALHEITIELTKIDELDAFYKRTVELGIERLGFERIALFLYDAEDGAAQGTYGTSALGNLTDEHHIRFKPDPKHSLLRAFSTSDRLYIDEQVTLYEDQQPVGVGWNAGSVLWNGNQNLGWLVIDNLRTQTPATKSTLNILGLYALTVGALLARKQVQKALRANEALYRMLAETITDVVMRTSVTGDYLYVSPSSQSVLGYAPHELVGKRVLDFFHPDDLSNKVDLLHEAQKPTSTHVGLVARFRHKQGHYIWLESSGQVIRAETGEVEGFISSSRDISERNRAEEALQENEAKYRHLVETMQGGLAIFDMDGKVTYVNDRAGEILGYTREEIIGTRAYDFINCLVSEEERLPLLQKSLDGSPKEVTAQHKRGHQVNLLVSGSPFVDIGGKYNGSFVVMTDISTQKQAEETLRQALAKEKELGDLKTRFVSMASHEFRTPLATILATTETLSAYRHKMTDEQIDRRLHNIFEQIGHLKNIMEDMLQLARIQARRVEFAPVLLDVDALCRSVIDEFREGPLASPRLNYQCNNCARALMLDKKLMRQILSNLISNALKYSDKAQDVHISLTLAEGNLILVVSDNGMGIPEADKKHLFEPFHRGVNVDTIPGTGLGLTIVKEAVELHNGEIELTSEQHQGTRVTVRIPVSFTPK